jgi:aspartyl-tRNA(Asn)/glutamyl-tRNA(Gln) amidotransferase subunit B
VQLCELLKAIQDGQIDTSRAREVFIEMAASGKSAPDVMKAQGIEKVDESELVELCKDLIATNPKIVADIRSGKQQAAGNLIGQAKKKNPNVNPGRFREIVIELVEKM